MNFLGLGCKIDKWLLCCLLKASMRGSIFEDFAGVEDVVRVEDEFNGLHQAEFCG